MLHGTVHIAPSFLDAGLAWPLLGRLKSPRARHSFLDCPDELKLHSCRTDSPGNAQIVRKACKSIEAPSHPVCVRFNSRLNRAPAPGGIRSILLEALSKRAHLYIHAMPVKSDANHPLSQRREREYVCLNVPTSPPFLIRTGPVRRVGQNHPRSVHLFIACRQLSPIPQTPSSASGYPQSQASSRAFGKGCRQSPSPPRHCSSGNPAHPRVRPCQPTRATGSASGSASPRLAPAP